MNKISFPAKADLALTGRCNLKCKHCNTSGTWNVGNELSFEEIRGVMDQLKELKVFNMDLFGGEPFCYPRIHDFLEMLNSYPIRVNILTNGTLVDEKIIMRLKQMRFLGTVQVSIDGATAEVHDWQRGEGSFQKAVRGVKLLKEGGIDVAVKAIINSHNYGQLEDMVELAMSLGLDGMGLGEAVECGKAAVYSSDMRFEGDAHRKIMGKMFALRAKYPDFSFDGTLAQKMEMLADFHQTGPGKGDRGNFSTCPAGYSSISIRADGKIVPCTAFWTLVCGDVREDSLEDIWNKSEMLNKIRALAEEPLTDHCENCAKCDYVTFCNGGCRAAAYYVSGNDLKGVDPATCLTFSNLTESRISRDEVLSLKECG